MLERREARKVLVGARLFLLDIVVAAGRDDLGSICHGVIVLIVVQEYSEDVAVRFEILKTKGLWRVKRL